MPRARQKVNTLIYNGDFSYQPPFTAATNASGSKYVDGTAAGSSTDDQWMWNFVRDVAACQAQFDQSKGYNAMIVEATDATGRGRVVYGSNTGTQASQSVPMLKRYAIPVLPNTSYTISADVETINSSGMGIVVNVHDAQGSRIAAPGSTPILGTNSKIPTSVTFTTGATAAFLIFYVGIITAGTIQKGTWSNIVVAPTAGLERTRTEARTLETGNRVKVSDEGTAVRITNPDDTSYVDIANNPVIGQNKSYSMQCEFKILGVPASGDGRLFVKLHGSVAGNRSGSIQYNATRIYTTVVKGDGSVTYDTPAAAGANWIRGKWYEAVATFDVTTGLLKLYINGVFVTSVTGDTTTPTGTSHAFIGSERNTGTPRTAPVVVNKCRAWEDVVLTAEEISAMYFNKRMPPYRNNLKLELLANEGTGTNMADSSGNGHDGTLVGSNVSFVTDVPCIERTKVT